MHCQHRVWQNATAASACLAVALPVVNAALKVGTLPEVVRIIISNGIILYALSKTKGGNQ